MKKLSVCLENCFGIGKLDFTFDFDSGKRAYSIYAPNGVMKTSFAKVFQFLSEGKKTEIKDRVYSNRKPLCKVQDESSQEIKAENIFVIHSYNKEYNADDKASTLIANKELREKYKQAIKSIEEKKKVLEESIKTNYGITRGSFPEDELKQCFKLSNENIFDFYINLFDTLDDSQNAFEGIFYNEVFNEKTLPILREGQIAKELQSYIRTYNDLIDKSPILNKQFNHYNAESIQKELNKHNFFKAEHKIILSDGTEIESIHKLNIKIQQEKNRILYNETLQDKFRQIDSKLQRNDDLRKFAKYLQENQTILPELENYENFQRTLWKGYFKISKDKLSELIDEYKKQKENIEKFTKEAQDGKTKWKEIVKIFNSRFKVPFTVNVANQDDVILKESRIPTFEFHFDDERGDQPSNQKKEDLKENILSNGEKKALYILDLLYEIEERKLKQTITLFIVDDIADSFDYKNKYAIIEYFYELQKEQNFRFIFLTHNFDFHRTISSRVDIKKNRLLAVKDDKSEITFSSEKCTDDPLENWSANLRASHNDETIVCCIAFARQLAVYRGLQDENKKLTSLLHIKPDTKGITIKNLESSFRKVFSRGHKEQRKLILKEKKKKVINVIYEVAEKALKIPESKSKLEHKIALSIAIRLKAEEFMIQRINDQSFCNSISFNQTIELISKFKERFPNEEAQIETLEEVNLMTPENIHLNSFMYEPILDMSAHHLYELYQQVKGLVVLPEKEISTTKKIPPLEHN